MKLPLALLLAVSLLPDHAAADTCQRWVSHVDPCDGIVAQNVCNYPSEWSPNQWINFKNWNYSSSASRACEKYVMKEAPDAAWAIRYVNATTYDCYWDWDFDGLGEDDYDSARTLVWREDVVKDECCSRTPNGPYTDSVGESASSDPTGQFSALHRKHILAANPARLSDASAAGVPDYAGKLGVGLKTAVAADDPDEATTWDSGGARSANIDHIIPRIDSNGCRCGDNSSANAAVISGELNTSMGRSCLDPRRIQFLNQWTTPAAGRQPSEAPLPTTESVANIEAARAAATGGCRATPGGSGLLMLALGGLVLRRRRSSHVSE